MDRIPQSVAKRVALKAYLASDHVSAATGKTIAIVISKNMGAFANPSAGATNATELSNGWYYVDLSTTDTGTAGPLVVRGTVATVDDVEFIFEVANAFNAGFTGVPGVIAGASGGLPTGDASGRVDASKLAGQTITAAAGVTFPSSVASPTNITAGTITTTTNLTNAPTSGDFTSTMKTSLNAATPAVTVSDKTGFSLSTAGILAIWHQLTAAIVTAGTIGKLIVDFLDVAVSSRLATSGYTVPPTASDNATAVWASGTRTLSSFGTLVADVATAVWAAGARTLTSFGSLVADTATAVWAAATRALTDKADFTLTAAYDAAKTAAQPGDIPTVGEIADQVWDEPLTGHAGAGSTGEALTAAAVASPTAVQNADALLGRNLAGGSNGGRTVQDALRPARNKVTIVGSTVTVYEEDDTTPAWTGALTTNPAAEPITGVDPA